MSAVNVTHIETDLRHSGQILLSQNGTMQSYYLNNGSNASAYDPKKGYLGGFMQLDKEKVILVAKEQHCIITWDRNQNQVTTLSGVCGTSGSSDAHFKFPTTIIKDMRKSSYVIVADTDNKRVISVNLDTGTATVIVELGEQTYGLLWVKEKLLVATDMYLSLVEWKDINSKATVIKLNGESGVERYGEFSNVKFKKLLSLQVINPDWIIATEQSNAKLLVLNIKSNTSIPVCIMAQGCAASSDIFDKMYDTLITNEGLYASGSKGIVKLTGKFSS